MNLLFTSVIMCEIKDFWYCQTFISLLRSHFFDIHVKLLVTFCNIYPILECIIIHTFLYDFNHRSSLNYFQKFYVTLVMLHIVGEA